jgi:cytoskeletal protein CcmA (bactofilin family)
VWIITRDEFEARYPRRVAPRQLVCNARGEFAVRRDSSLSGTLKRRVVVESGVQLVVDGTIIGKLIVAPTATVYVSGRVRGNMILAGNALVLGEVTGDLIGSPGSYAAVFGKVRGRTVGLEAAAS